MKTFRFSYDGGFRAASLNFYYCRYKSISRAIAILVFGALLFTGLPMTEGNLNSYAAMAKPAKVMGFSKKVVGGNYITLKWRKLNKNGTGYVVYRYNAKTKKWIQLKKLGRNTVQYKNTGLKANTTYKYSIRAYRSYKQKQYYNSNTRKWQVKRPSKKNWKGRRSRTVTKYIYGAYSPVLSLKTTATKKASTGKTSAKDSKFKVYMFGGTADTYDMKDCPAAEITATSSGKITWTSSNPSVATVTAKGNNALVKFVKAGKTTITAKNYDGQSKVAVFTITDSKAKKNNIVTIGEGVTPTVPKISMEKISMESLCSAWLSQQDFSGLSEMEKFRRCHVGIAHCAIRFAIDNYNGAPDCSDYSSAALIILKAAGIKCEVRSPRNDETVMGKEKAYSFYGGADLFNHINDWVWIDGVKYVYDAQVYGVNGLLKWEWD